MSDDLDRAVDARIDSYRPDAVPPFAAIEARKRGRDRRRLAVGGGLFSVVAVAGAVAVLSSLPGGGDRLTPEQAASGAASASTDATSEPSVVPSPPPDAGYSFCDDSDGDGSGLELSGVQVDRDGTTLKILWVLGGEVPTQGRARYTLDAANEDGTASQQFVVGYQDGNQVEYYALDLATGKRKDVKGEANIDDSFLISAFPAGALNEKFNYSVSGLLGESVADRCPEKAGTVLYDR